MATTVLGRADLAMLADPTRFVIIPHLTAMDLTLGFSGSSVRFAGDTWPTAFAGEGRTATFSLTARFGKHNQGQAASLVALVEAAASSHDPRLFLRSHWALVPGLDAACAVLISEVRPKPAVGLYLDVTLTAERVQHEGTP